MAHQRKLIRDAVVAKLKTLSAVQGRVFSNRARMLFAKELPAILVYTGSEPPAEIETDSPREYKRALNLKVEIVAQADGSKEEVLDDLLDELCDAVERVMTKDPEHGKLAMETFLGETELELLAEGDRPTGSATITFSIPYLWAPPLTEAEELDAFEEAHSEIDVAPVDETIEAEDSVALPQE